MLTKVKSKNKLLFFKYYVSKTVVNTIYAKFKKSLKFMSKE